MESGVSSQESGVRGRNRPLRGFATHREANTPSGASAEGSVVGVQSWSWRVEVGVRERCSKGAPALALLSTQVAGVRERCSKGAPALALLQVLPCSGNYKPRSWL